MAYEYPSNYIIAPKNLYKLCDIKEKTDDRECSFIPPEVHYHITCKICKELIGTHIYYYNSFRNDWIQNHNHEFELSITFRGDIPKDIRELTEK